MSNYFPTIPIVGVSFDAALSRRMNLYRGVVPMQISACQSLDHLLATTEADLARRGLASPGDVIVYVGGTHLVGIDGYANAIKVHRLGAKP
jgi:pyruvate kinase